MKRLLAHLIPPLLVFAAALLAWQLLATKVHKAYLLPHPRDVCHVFFPPADNQDALDLRRTLLVSLWGTAKGALLGLALSVSSGTVAALLLASNRWVRRGLYPYAVLFQTVPIIAIAPMLVIWVGYGLPTIIATSAIASLFPVIANTFAGLRSTDPAHLELFSLYRASLWSRLVKLRLPSALPAILTGWRIAAGLAVIGALTGEFVSASSGDCLGALIDSARTSQHTDVVFAAVLLASAFGIALFLAISLLSALLLSPWHASERADE